MTFQEEIDELSMEALRHDCYADVAFLLYLSHRARGVVFSEMYPDAAAGRIVVEVEPTNN